MLWAVGACLGLIEVAWWVGGISRGTGEQGPE